MSHVVTRIWMEGNKIYGEAEVLNTPQGKIIQELIRARVPIGVSSRGAGTSTQKDGVEVINEDDFVLETFDFVCSPSTPNAYIEGITENLHPAFREGASEDDLSDCLQDIQNRIRTLRKESKSQRRSRLIDAYLGLVECESVLEALELKGLTSDELEQTREKLQYYKGRVDRKIQKLEQQAERRTIASPPAVKHPLENSTETPVVTKLNDAKYWQKKYEDLAATIKKQRESSKYSRNIRATKEFAERLLVAVKARTAKYEHLRASHNVLRQRYDKALDLLGGIIERHDRGKVIRAVRESVDKHPQLRPLVSELLQSKSAEEVSRRVETFLRALKAGKTVREMVRGHTPAPSLRDRGKMSRRAAKRYPPKMQRRKGRRLRRGALERAKQATESLRRRQALRERLQRIEDLVPSQKPSLDESKSKSVLSAAPKEDTQLRRSDDYGVTIVEKLLQRGRVK